MRKRKLSPIGAAFAALVLLVVFFMVRGTLHQPVRIVLPQETSSGSDSGETADDSSTGRVAVRPDTVQSAIATLERPARYTRTITIERYYNGGSGVDRSSVYVDGPWMRVDTEHSGGELSHTITDGGHVWRWYGSSKQYFSGTASFSADEEQGIPTYEDILHMDASRIALADYRVLETADCIFVETFADEEDYVERYWVSVSTGLLCAAEKLRGEEVVYRMAGLNVDTGEIAAEIFVLPDETILHESQADSAER